MTKYRLKAWTDPNWQRKLSKTLTVSRVDEDISIEKQGRKRKPWQLALTQKPEANVGKMNGLPNGRTLLLSEGDVLALVRYLLEPQTVIWSDNPEPTEPVDASVLLFLQAGMMALTESGDVVNGEAHWSPRYFRRQKPYDHRQGLRTRKLHTLPWRLTKKRRR